MSNPKKPKHGMRQFWVLARGLLRYRTRVIFALICAFVGAAGLGVGLIGAIPVLKTILEPGKAAAQTLPKIVGEFNTNHLNGRIPANWIAELPEGRFTAVVWIVIALGVLTVLSELFNFLHSYLSMTVVTQTIADIRERVFAHIVHLPMRVFMMSGPTNQLTRVVNDCGELGGGFNNLLSKSVSQIFKAGMALAAAFLVHWELAAIAIPTAVVLWFVIRTAGNVIRRGARKGLVARGGVLQAAGEAIENLRVVKTSTAEDRESERFHTANRALLRQEMRVRTAKSISSPIVEIVTLCALGTLTLIATKTILDGHLDSTSFLITLGSLAIAGGCLKPLTGLYNDLQAAAAAAERVSEVLNEPQEAGYAPDRPVLPRHHDTIRFEHVTYTYPRAEHPALRDIDLTIRHGETVAFVGPNGSGKTTLLSLLPALIMPDGPATGARPRVEPPVNGTADVLEATVAPAPIAKGRILVDGVDISTVSLESLRGQIGVVTQETMLFKGTIRSNLLYGVRQANDAQLHAAARQARAEEFILARPGGYEAEIGERGSGLSGGQRQRIAIARAILRDPAILILDEATSMIDADSEAKIAAAIDEFSEGRTCLIIAHRLSTVIHADRIVVMDHGKIVDVGTHHELLSRCAVYRLIAEHQLVKAGAPEPVVAK